MRKTTLILALMLIVATITLGNVQNASATSTTVTTKKDAYVDEAHPSTNYGSNVYLEVCPETANQLISFVEFDVSPYQCITVTHATLKLYAHDTSEAVSDRTYRIQAVTGAWTEGGVTWNNQPSVGSDYVEKLCPNSTDGLGWWSVDVTSLYTSGLVIGFRIMDSGGSSTAFTNFVSYDNGTSTYYPRLEVTYTYSYTYTFNAPKYENDTSYGSLNATANYGTKTSTTFTVPSSGATIYFNNKPLFYAWQTSASNYRILYAQNDTTFTFYVPESTYYVYEFSLRDYMGVVNSSSMLECYRVIGDELQLTERLSITNRASALTLTLNIGSTYYLIMNMTGYEYHFGWFLAGSSTSNTLTMYGYDFPSQIVLAYQYIRAYAWRTDNNTVILLSYENTEADTNLVEFYVTYTNGTTAHYDNSTADTVTFTWNGADTMTDYVVYMNSNSTKLGTITYKQVMVHLIDVSSPFDLSSLGTFPNNMPATKVVPALIIIFVAAAFSTLTVPLGLVMAVFAAAIERYMGWYAITPYGMNADIEFLFIIGSLAILYALYHAARRG